jgi:hypothetical protein
MSTIGIFWHGGSRYIEARPRATGALPVPGSASLSRGACWAQGGDLTADNVPTGSAVFTGVLLLLLTHPRSTADNARGENLVDRPPHGLTQRRPDAAVATVPAPDGTMERKFPALIRIATREDPRPRP